MFRKIKRYWYRITHPVIGEVWQLHRVTNEVSKEVAQRDFEITPNRLINLIEEYLRKGYSFVSVDRLCDMINTNKFDKKFVVVTLDDGYADNFEIAYPIFKRYKIPFCIFVTKDFIDNGKKLYQMLSEDQIIQLSNDSLCTIGSHTVTHPHLSRLTVEEQCKEINVCGDWLASLIGHPVTCFAYPYGDYNKETLAEIKQSGLSCAFSAWGGPIRDKKKLSKYEIPRSIIMESTIIY